MPLVFGTATDGYPQIERCWYLDPLGNRTDLTTDLNQQFKDGIEGRFMPPIQHLMDSVPEMDGSRYRGTRVLSNLIDIPMTFLASDTTRMRAMLRALAQGINPKKGVLGPTPGQLWVTTVDGITRYINCLYQKGLGEAEGGTDTGNGDLIPVRNIVLEFLAFDPFWYQSETVVKFADVNTTPATFLPMPLPMPLSSSTVAATFYLTNEGDVDAYPIWQINGPGNIPTLSNAVTGERLSINVNLLSVQSVIIDTRPGFSTVTLNGGRNLWPQVTGALFSIPSGNSVITVDLINATTASSVVLQYHQRFLSI